MGGVSVALAILVGLASSFIQSLGGFISLAAPRVAEASGLTIQRKSHVQEEALPLPLRRRPIRRPLWLIGFGIYITSNIFATIFQLDTLPIVILAPLGAVSLIFNGLLAKAILGDAFGLSSAAGTALVAVGATLIAVFGVVQEQEHTLTELLELWARPAFLAFFSVVSALTLLVLVGVSRSASHPTRIDIQAHISAWRISRKIWAVSVALSDDATPPNSPPVSNYASPHDPPPIPFRPAPGLRRWSTPVSPFKAASPDPDKTSLVSKPSRAYVTQGATGRPRGVRFNSLDNVVASAVDPALAFQKELTFTGLAFAAASGTISGMSLVLAKAAVELLVITLKYIRTGLGENQFVRVQSWFLLAGLAIGGLSQLVYLNYSLTFASPALICPLAFCFFNLSSIFGGS